MLKTDVFVWLTVNCVIKNVSYYFRIGYRLLIIRGWWIKLLSKGNIWKAALIYHYDLSVQDTNKSIFSRSTVKFDKSVFVTYLKKLILFLLILNDTNCRRRQLSPRKMPPPPHNPNSNPNPNPNRGHISSGAIAQILYIIHYTANFVGSNWQILEPHDLVWSLLSKRLKISLYYFKTISFKGKVIQIENALINDRLRAPKLS